MNVAFLGLGAIGRPMATRIAAAGMPLSIWNRTRGKAQDLAKTVKARVASDPADAVEGAQIVVTCLSTSPDVASLLDGPTGLLATIARGTILVDCTSGDPATSRSIAARLAERGVDFIDAPVSGGVSGAEKGALTVMVGGKADVLERARPVIATFGQKIVHCGDVGAGDSVKAMNQFLLAVHIWTAGEALVGLVKEGVKPGVALDVINASSGRSNASMNLFPERVLTRAFPRTFRLALLDKDIGIAAGIARAHKIPAPVLQLTTDLMKLSRRTLGEEADHVEAVQLVEQWAGTKIE